MEFLQNLHRELWTDVELKAKDGGSLKAHRSVLAMYSDDLAALFLRAERRKTPNVVELPFTLDCLKLVMEMMYRGVVEVDDLHRTEFGHFIDLYTIENYTGESISFYIFSFFPTYHIKLCMDPRRGGFRIFYLQTNSLLI